MLRKSLLSLVGGTLFAAVLSLVPAARAECGGICPDWLTIGGTAYAYAGCRLYVNYRTGEVIGATCSYTEAGSGGGGCSNCAE